MTDETENRQTTQHQTFATRQLGAGASAEELVGEIFARDQKALQDWQNSAPRRRLADALLAMRKRAGLSQLDVARAADWNQTHVARMESATGPWPNRESLNAYIHACDDSATVGLVIAHPDGRTLHIDAAVAFGNQPSDQQFEALTDVTVSEPATKTAQATSQSTSFAASPSAAPASGHSRSAEGD